MRTAWLTRFNALFLGLLLAGGGSGLPLVDALFHHLHGTGTPAPIQVGGASDAGHAERCTLGVAAPAMAPAADPPTPELRAVVFPAHGLPAPVEAPRAGVPEGSARPRAPPAWLV